jgi:hypothetical protein
VGSFGVLGVGLGLLALEVVVKLDSFAAAFDFGLVFGAAFAVFDDFDSILCDLILCFSVLCLSLLFDLAAFCACAASALVDERVTRFVGCGADAASDVLRFLGGILNSCRLLGP